MTEDDIHEQPTIIEKLFGADYNGPFSTFAEWHAAEYGAITGFVAGIAVVSPTAATLLGGLLGIMSGKRLVTGEMRRQIFHEKHYFGVAAIVLFFATVGISLLA